MRRTSLRLLLGVVTLLTVTVLGLVFLANKGTQVVHDSRRPLARQTHDNANETADKTADAAAHNVAHDAASATEDAVILRPAVSQPNELIQGELSRVDPTVDGWDTEAFSEAAAKQLDRLAVAIISPPSESDRVSLQHVVQDDFSCTSLRPRSLTSVFEDQELVVSRWEQGTPRPTNQVDHRHHDGFQRAAAALLAPWGEAGRPEIRVTFKIVEVNTDGAMATTTVMAQLAGPTTSGFAQQNATWNCHWQPLAGATAPLLTRIELAEFEEVQYRGHSPTVFQESTNAVLGHNSTYHEQFGRDNDYWQRRLDWRLGLDIVGPHGLAIGDVNGDGLDDLFVCEPGGLPNRLFVQNADGTATDMSSPSGVDWLEPTASALLLDLDNDGDQDLIFASGRLLVTCENLGHGTFQRQTVFTLSGTARSLAAADFNQDGKLDIYVCCYFYPSNSLAGIGLAVPIPYHDANNGPPNQLFANQGAWQFKDITSEVGLDANNRRFSFAAAWEDYDNDGDADLYVANDYGRNNLYRNDGGHFVDVAASAAVEDMASSMSVSWADYNHDGLMDVYVANMFSTAGNRVMHQLQFRSESNNAERDAYRRFARGNSLFENNGDGTFRDVSLETGVNMGRWAWGSLFADLNNDGWQDLLSGNGMITSVEDPGDL